jgi:2-polyprenyl-3-methyl-5-hydroxy-6-metoxy-1,4-benzoquinol methylase
MPFIEEQLNGLTSASGSPLRVLDTACGTGMHAIALAQRGYHVAAADLSTAMIDLARQNAAEAQVDIRLEVVGFGALAAAFGVRDAEAGFDAVLCLGNSLPHVPDEHALAAALVDFTACLRPGGLLLLQNRNLDAVLAGSLRWMEPQAHRSGDAEALFIRFYDFEPDGSITFNMLTLERQADAGWTQQTTATRLLPLTHSLLTRALAQAGFVDIQAYGSLADTPFDPHSSPNLVLTAKR